MKTYSIDAPQWACPECGAPTDEGCVCVKCIRRQNYRDAIRAGYIGAEARVEAAIGDGMGE